MKTKTTYIANDGKEFSDKDECLQYEQDCDINKFSPGKWVTNHKGLWDCAYLITRVNKAKKEVNIIGFHDTGIYLDSYPMNVLKVVDPKDYETYEVLPPKGKFCPVTVM